MNTEYEEGELVSERPQETVEKIDTIVSEKPKIEVITATTVEQAQNEDEEEKSLRPPPPSCQICNQEAAKYKCPACLLRTCSLKCVNLHKTQMNCCGKFKYEKFYPPSQLDENFAKKDINYLSEMLQRTENSKKRLNVINKNWEILRYKLLKVYAQKNAGVIFRSAPPVMSRHRENISFWHSKSKTLYWTCEFSFVKELVPGKDGAVKMDLITMVVPPAAESKTMMEILEQIKIEDMKISLLLQERLHSQKLAEGVKKGIAEVYFVDMEKTRDKIVYKVDPEATLSSVVNEKYILEYPSFRIVFEPDITTFNEKFVREFVPTSNKQTQEGGRQKDTQKESPKTGN